MKKLAMTNFGIKHPWVVMLIVLAGTLFFTVQFPKVAFDNDPENMLSENEHVRQFHSQVKEKFSLYDFVVVGIVNDTNPDGVFNTGTLGRIHQLTGELLSLKRSETGLPSITRPAMNGKPAEEVEVDLVEPGLWNSIMNSAFHHNPNHLFDTNGASAIIAKELISPSVVDNIKQAELGSLKLEYLMEDAPTTREKALEIRDDAMNNPLYLGTLVSEDAKAICIYIPIREKTFSYNVANLVKNLTSDWTEDKVYITGLPVAEDTFGVEMLVQMATSAPMAGLVIFLLLLLFFRRLSLIIAPMLLAIISVLCTMGLLIGLGFKVHIMSSMIAIFLMPIAVADSVHILSEFFDTYHRHNDKAKTIKAVISHLFKPMLYTSLTTIAGFASLATTPIPPVRIFGLHVAFGVALAWLLTMVFVPAYIMLFVRESMLNKLPAPTCSNDPKERGWLNCKLEALGSYSYYHWRGIVIFSVIAIVISAIGVTKINVNDNPVKWFTETHEIREADRVLNQHFGGTYTAYLTFTPVKSDSSGCTTQAEALKAAADKQFSSAFPASTVEYKQHVERLEQLYSKTQSDDTDKFFADLVEACGAIDARNLTSWNSLADTVMYLEPDGLTFDALTAAVNAAKDVSGEDKAMLLARLKGSENLTGKELQERTMKICDEFTSMSFKELTYAMQAELTAPAFKRPDVLLYLETLQKHFSTSDVVGKTSSAVDALKKASYELSFVEPPPGASEAELAECDARNSAGLSVPDTAAETAQVYIQLEGMKKKDTLFHLLTRDYEEANVWFQLKSGDNKDMESVVKQVREYISENPPPVALNAEWAGLTYLNVVWQEKMVKGMLSSLVSSFVVVFIMMIVLFRSPLYGVLAMMPLSITILFIYGLIGWIGKDYDMPVAVLSSLTLGLSVDFAIHFLERARELQAQLGSWRAASAEMFKEPAMAISRNAITISVGFTPLLLAPLVPYRTVGLFLATIMAVSWLGTLFILPAMLTMLRKVIFKNDSETPTTGGSK